MTETAGSNAPYQLPRLRRKRRVNLPRIAGRFIKGIAEVESQVKPYAEAWDQHNALALRADGPLWVALGDSSSQGVGASTWKNGWIHQVADQLRAETGDPWRVIVLAMSGGRFNDVVDHQMPAFRAAELEPQLTTCVIGSNDLMWRRGTDNIVSDAQATMQVLPSATLVSRLNGPGPRPKALNAVFEQASERGDVDLFNIWNWPSGRGALAADHIHPSDVGYAHMTELAWLAISAALEL